MLPKSIQIQTIDYCNRSCEWCPNSKMEKSHHTLMNEDVYVKILDDLHKVNYKGSLHLYLMGEPLMDDRITEFIRKARDQFPENVIYLGTNGDMLDESIVKLLLDAGLTWIGVSVYDDSNPYLKILSEKYPQVSCANLEDLRDTYYNRAGHVDIDCWNPQFNCGWVFDKAYINYKGEVILCCSDYDYEIRFGNIMQADFNDIYNSDHYNQYRQMHEKGTGQIMPLCDRCNKLNRN